jgi:hypothetical protein
VGQGEIRHPVVHQVDGGVLVPKLAFAPLQCARIGNQRMHAALCKHLPEQLKLGGQVLAGRFIVHDGDGAQGSAAAL